jgi:hypothetical protein
MDQGLEFHTASSDFTAGGENVKAGDYIIRGDQPFRTIADIYFSVQRYSSSNPSPYDDTGWTLQYTRDVAVLPLTDKMALTQPMKPVTGKVTAPGGIAGTGNVVVVEATGDNNLITVRNRLKDVKMSAAQEGFDLNGRRFGPGSIIIPNANLAQINPVATQLGLSGVATATAPTVPSHDLDIPRILYLHNWTRTQDEGWVRAALETYGVPFTYMAEKEIYNMPNLRQQYDVIIYPHTGTQGAAIIGAGPPVGGTPIPYKKTAETPSFGTPDSTSDIRGSMGVKGLMNLYNFVDQGGTLITEGSTATLFPEYNFAPGVTVEQTTGLFAQGVIVKGMISDPASPIAYGLGYNQMAVYFNSSPVLNVGGGGGGRGGRGATTSQNTSPMANQPTVNPFSPGGVALPDASGAGGRAGGRAGGGGGGRAGGGGRGGFGGGAAGGTRVVLQFPPTAAEMLLSGGLENAEQLQGRAQVIDAKVGNGHVVMFAIRPFWRWQTHGTYILGFNAIMHWNDLGAGAPAAQPAGGRGGRGN